MRQWYKWDIGRELALRVETTDMHIHIVGRIPSGIEVNNLRNPRVWLSKRFDRDHVTELVFCRRLVHRSVNHALVVEIIIVVAARVAIPPPVILSIWLHWCFFPHIQKSSSISADVIIGRTRRHWQSQVFLSREWAVVTGLVVSEIAGQCYKS